MKLPFKIPSFKLPAFKLPALKLPKFGKKKADDDDDDDDDDLDFDPADFEGDENASSGEAPSSPAGEGKDASETSASEGEAPVSPATEGGADDDADTPSSPADDVPPEAKGEPGEEAEGEASVDDLELGDDMEDIDFGDDDDDDDEEGKGGLDPKRKKMLIIGGGASAGLLLIGGLAWFFMSGDAQTAEEKSNIPKVAMDIAPKKKGGQGLSLNAIAAGAQGPGAGMAIPAISPQAFASLSPPAVTDGPLADASDPTMSEQTPQGPLPKIAESGTMAWQVYAKSFENQDARPRVAIVIRGLGMSAAATDAAIRLLPGSVTLAFDPYAPSLLDWVAKARQAGHEVMIMMPLEPSTFPTDDPGPQALMTTNAPEENRLRMEYVLSRMTSYIGVMTVMGTKFNTSEEHLRVFLEEIKSRGLMFLEGDVDNESLAPKIATEIGLPRALTNIILDTIPTKGAIDAQLAELEDILAAQPAAVAIADAYPSSIERIATWTAGLEAKNLVLAPLSALADKQFLQ